MNAPLTHGKYTFYQSGFDQTADGKDVSVLSVAYDPGRFLKYLGSLMICVGIFVMSYVKGRLFKRLFSRGGQSEDAGGSGVEGRRSSRARHRPARGKRPVASGSGVD